MEKFTQLLQPVADNLYVSALVALIPIVFYLVTLAGLKVKGWLTGLKCRSTSQHSQHSKEWFMVQCLSVGLF